MGVRALLPAWITRSHFSPPGPSLSPQLPPMRVHALILCVWDIFLAPWGFEPFPGGRRALFSCPSQQAVSHSAACSFSGSVMLQLTFCNSPPALGSAPTETPDSSLSAGVPLKPSRELPSKTPSFPPAQDSKRVCEGLDPLHICKTLGCREPRLFYSVGVRWLMTNL